MLDAIGAGLQPRIGDRDWGELWRESDELADTKDEIISMRERRKREVAAEPQLPEKEYASPLWHQMKIVLARMNLSFWRTSVAVIWLFGCVFLSTRKLANASRT